MRVCVVLTFLFSTQNEIQFQNFLQNIYKFRFSVCIYNDFLDTAKIWKKT